MFYKTERLANLFPDAYAVQDTESLLHRLLDTLGAELYRADQDLKALLKSHWIAYAKGQALDGLGSIYGVTRRRLPDGTQESDEAFRLRLRSVVQLFQGGGTVTAIKGAVRSALGLPFNLAQLNLPHGLTDLRRDLENLIVLEEFSPLIERSVGSNPDVITVDDRPANLLVLQLSSESARTAQPEIQWTFTQGAGRRLRIELQATHEGIQSLDRLVVLAGETLLISSGAELANAEQPQRDNRLVAQIIKRQPDGSELRRNVSNLFANLDGSTPAKLPTIPSGTSDWAFQAEGGLYDISTFDHDGFDLPQFTVEIRQVRFQLLTFEVRVPYLIQEAVQAIADRYQYQGNLFVFEGLRPEQIPAVVEQTQAAGVRGHVNFSLNFLEIHNQDDTLRWVGRHQVTEDANATDAFQIGSFKRNTESHSMTDRFAIGGLFDVATFDSDFGFF